MMVKVGLVISFWDIPSVSASPLTRVVLPAPRSPCRITISPPVSVVAVFVPIWMVSS